MSGWLLLSSALAQGPEEAERYFLQGRWLKAAQAYEALLRKEPQNVLYLKRRAEALFWAEDFAASYEAWKRALALGPGDEDARLYLSLLEALRSRDLGGLQEMLKERPQDGRLLRALGVAHLWVGDPELAVGYLWEAQRQQPQDWLSPFLLGSIYEAWGYWDYAISAYQRAVKLNGQFARALNNLGYVMKEKHYYIFAIQYYRRAIAIEPEEAGYYYNLGNALVAEGKVKEAYEAYRKALELDPTFAKAHYNMGRTYVRLGQLEKAVEEFQLYLKYWHPGIPLRDAPPPKVVRAELKELQELLRELKEQ